MGTLIAVAAVGVAGFIGWRYKVGLWDEKRRQRIRDRDRLRR